MERDFMGLNSKNSGVVIKEEAIEGGLDSGSQVFSKGSAVHRFSSTKVTTLLHSMSIKVPQEEKLPRVVFDPLASPGFDPSHRRLPDEIKGVPISLNKGFLKTNFTGQGQNFASATMKQQFLGGAPMAATHGVRPSSGSIARTTEPWYNANVSGSSAQLTIFYAGTVNVYDEISPEKAQAIMLLAGNGSAAASNMAQTRGQVQAPNSKQAAGDGAFVNQPAIPAFCSGLSSPMSVSSHHVGQSGGGFSNNDEMIVAKTNGISTTPSNLEPPKLVNSLGSVPPSTMIPSAVPQARKASLARFLEKRKERVMNSSPYNLTNKKTSECSNRDSTGIGFSATSGMISASLNQQGE